jgi:MFS family permease
MRRMTRAVLRRVSRVFLPDSRAGRTLAIGAGIDSLGSGLFFASTTLYFVGVVGFPAAEVALATTVAGLFALLAPIPLGRLADRIGAGPFYVGLLLVRGAGRSCFAFVDGFTGFVILMVLMTAADWTSIPIKQAVVTAVIGGKDRTRTMASVRATRNIGLTAGFLLAGVVFAVDHPLVFAGLFLANGVAFGVVALMVRHVLRTTGTVVQRKASAKTRTETEAEPGAAAAAAPVRPPLRDFWFMVFTFGNAVLSLYDTVLIVLLPVWILEYTDIPSAWVPVLLAVNTVLTVLLQVYVSRFAEGTRAAMRLLPVSGGFMVICCAAFALAQSATGVLALTAVVLAVVLLSLAENLHSVAAWELSAELSPEAARARYLGAFSLSLSGQKMAGPTLLVVVLMPLGLLAWPVLAGAFGAASALSRTAARRSLAERATTAPRAAPQAVTP